MTAIKIIDSNKVAKLKDRVFYGIDLGTTFTVVAKVDLYNEPGITSIIPVKLINIEQYSPLEYDGSDKSEMMASVVAVNDRGQMFVGNKLYRLKGHPLFRKDVNLFYHWKLDLGISVKPLYKYAVRNDLDCASKVAGKILNYIRIQAINKDDSWKNVIVSVPASFQANQRNDVIEAINYAGIEATNNQLIDEPNAALLGYLNQLSNEQKQELLHNGSKIILVVDFGGGTCDLSLLRLQLNSRFELEISNLAISRYNDLGGQDIDTIIAEKKLLPLFLNKHDESNFDNETIEHIIIPQLSVAAEKLKIDLSKTISSRYLDVSLLDKDQIKVMKSTLFQVEIKIKDKQYTINEVSLNGEEFMEVISFLFIKDDYKLEVVDKVIHSMPSVVDDILQKADITRNEINYVLFAGGSVQNILFVNETLELLPGAKSLLPQRPDTLVAQGAAVYSFYKNGLGIDLIKPINSETIGIITANASFYPLIKSGAKLPSTFELPNFTVQKIGQKQIEIPFCIGSNEAVVQVLRLTLPSLALPGLIIKISGTLSADKTFKVQVSVGNDKIAESVLLNPFELAHVSEENRIMMGSLRELEEAKIDKNSRREKELLYKIIGEYYELSNYSRCIAMCDEYLNKFDPISFHALNYKYCAYDQLGQQRNAGYSLDKALKHHPLNTILVYNKSIHIEKSKGKISALEYLENLPENLKKEISISLRIANLELELNKDKTNALQIANEFKQKKLSGISSFDLKQLYKLLDKLSIPYDINELENNGNRVNKDSKFSFKKSDLLKVKSEVPEKN